MSVIDLLGVKVIDVAGMLVPLVVAYFFVVYGDFGPTKETVHESLYQRNGRFGKMTYLGELTYSYERSGQENREEMAHVVAFCGLALMSFVVSFVLMGVPFT